MKIALIYAMPKEIDSLLVLPQTQPLETTAGVHFYQIAKDIIACAGGIGKVNAAMAAQICISRHNPDCIINIGVAGCFENTPVGTILLPTQFIQHDVDTSGCGDPVGLVSTVNQISFPVSYLERAKTALQNIGVHFLCGTGATGDWFAKNGARAQWIQKTFAPLFIEMEGCAIAQVCLRNRTPFLALKSVSDCIFGNDNYDFNFPAAMKSLNDTVMNFIPEFLNCP